MKKLFYYAISALALCSTSCKDNDDDEYRTYSVTVQLAYPAESDFKPVEGVNVKLTNTTGSALDAATDNAGKATFTVPAGVYEASATDVRVTDGTGEIYIYSGIKSNITVTEAWTETQAAVQLELSESKQGQVVIKELYTGGCQRNDGSGTFSMDKYVVLYNNSDRPASLDNLCLGMVLPYNAQATNNDYVDGVLSYDAEGWIPAGNGIWYFPANVTIEPGRQIVIALTGAINHTSTYENSVNLSNPDYYCTYDITQYDNTSYYPSPSDVIPTSHYLPAVKYGLGNAWPLSNTSPAFFVFTTKDVTPVAFATDPSNINYHGGTVSQAQIRRTVPTEWIIDAVEIFTTGSDNNRKRLTAAVDAGQTYLANTFGYTTYRNVDEEATKAIEGNEAKLVYGYNLGTEIDGRASTDPSGIDAEASLRNGARIVYRDTNNSTNDFHQRRQASLRD
jgi:hypothetical protein